ncbi:MAG: hypothetical protein U1G08_15105 [Verrucomicrobiota bacterium]
MADLTSGLVTASALGQSPPCVRVTWIAWDSPFRGSGLEIGDRILMVNGAPIVPPGDLEAAKRREADSIGLYSESQGFARLGLTAGSPITLKVRRRAPLNGWIELTISARLAEKRYYRDENNAVVFGEGGPNTMTSDGFSACWGGWYDETMVAALSRILDADRRQTSSFVSRFEARNLRETHGAQVAFARKAYPGAWASALGADFDAAVAVCDGRRVLLPPNALDFRRRGEELAAEVRTKAQTAWSAFQESRRSEIVPAFPAVNPVRDDVRTVTGKLVVLPPLRNSDWISDAGHGWFAAGGSGWYFLDAESARARAMLKAQRRYAKLVDPNLQPQWEFVARITGESRLIVVGERAEYGLVAEPVAALVGGALYVDLTQPSDATVPFAGEEGLVDESPKLPPPDASPAEVMLALVGAVKNDDLALWRALHVSWEVERLSAEDGTEKLVVHPCAPSPDESMFEEARRSIMGRVLDAQVAWVDDPKTLVDATRFKGASVIEEVEVWLEHVGEFEGERRTFCDTTVRPKWTLQRINGGPWRIATVQPI